MHIVKMTKARRAEGEVVIPREQVFALINIAENSYALLKSRFSSTGIMNRQFAHRKKTYHQDMLHVGRIYIMISNWSGFTDRSKISSWGFSLGNREKWL